MTNEQREAIETMQHWIEYEKKHKDEINKADELIHIQDTVLSLIKEQEEEIEKKDKQIDLMAERINWLCKTNGILLDREHGVNFTEEDIKQYFERKVEDVKD